MKWLTLLIAVLTLALSSCDKPDPGYVNLTPESQKDTLDITIPDSGHEVKLVEFRVSSSPAITPDYIYTSISGNNGSVPTPPSWITAAATDFPSPETEVRVTVPITVYSDCIPGIYTVTITVDNRKTRNSIDYIINAL